MHEPSVADASASPSLPSPSLQCVTDRLRRSNVSPPPVDRVIIEEVVFAVLDTMDGRLSDTEASLLREIADLGRIIQEAKTGLAEVSLNAITGNHIPDATVELDAIIEHTANATNSILASCERLDELTADMNAEQAGVTRHATMRIYEACNFQDISGQRISKVVKALQAIEVKIAVLSARYAASAAHPPRPQPASQSDDAGGDNSLTNGPALPHQAMCQDDVDKLMADLER
jgi:chemotaxis protein CheZ